MARHAESASGYDEHALRLQRLDERHLVGNGRLREGVERALRLADAVARVGQRVAALRFGLTASASKIAASVNVIAAE